MIYIFNFRYKPDTDLNVLNNFIEKNNLKWKARNVELNSDIHVVFTLTGKTNFECDFGKIKDSGISIDSIEVDNGKFIEQLTIN